MPFNIGGNRVTSLGAKLFNSTSFIRNGLICLLDAGNPDSYGGSGSTWYDISGNGNNGTIYGTGVTFNLDYGGVFQLKGETGHYIHVPLNRSNANYTVIGAARYLTAVAATHTNAQGGRIISAKNNNWLLGQWYGYTENYYAAGWVTASGAGNTDTYWRIYAGTGNISSDTYNFYVNGSLVTSGSGGSAGPDEFAIGYYGPGNSEYANGQIGILMVYDRVLSDTEILQLYQVIRPRYEKYFNCGYGCVLYNYDPGCTPCNLSKAYSLSTTGSNSSCGSGSPYGNSVYGDALSMPYVNRFFTDVNLTTAFNGQGKWYESSDYVGTSFRISSDGYVIGEVAC